MNRLPNLTQTELHLSDEQIAELLDQPTQANPHLEACAACHAEVATLRASLANFRVATTSLASATVVSQRPAPATTPFHFRRQVWAASFATVAVLFAVSVSVIRPHRETPAVPVTPPVAVAANLSDEALLDGIQQDLSTSIPPSLQPLAIPAANTSK